MHKRRARTAQGNAGVLLALLNNNVLTGLREQPFNRHHDGRVRVVLALEAERRHATPNARRRVRGGANDERVHRGVLADGVNRCAGQERDEHCEVAVVEATQHFLNNVRLYGQDNDMRFVDDGLVVVNNVDFGIATKQTAQPLATLLRLYGYDKLRGHRLHSGLLGAVDRRRKDGSAHISGTNEAQSVSVFENHCVRTLLEVTRPIIRSHTVWVCEPVEGAVAVHWRGGVWGQRLRVTDGRLVDHVT